MGRVTEADDPRVLELLTSLSRDHELPEGSANSLALLLGLVQASPHSLTAVRDPLDAVQLHVADSLVGLGVADLSGAERIADLGSGAGFPGLVLAVARPKAHVVLVESVGKKAAFLVDAAERMRLTNVEVLPVRAESWAAGLGTIDAVTARALAPLGVLAEYAAPLLRPEGVLVAWKGRRNREEEDTGRRAAAVLAMSGPEALKVHGQGTAERHLYLSRKVGVTPGGYPRRAGMASKYPLGA